MNEQDPDKTADLPSNASANPSELMRQLFGENETGRKSDTSLTDPASETVTQGEANRLEVTSGHTPTFDGLSKNDLRPQVPGYEILGTLGRGGMGVVYRAKQIALNRIVALKMILAGPEATPLAIQRFRSEAQAVARFQHPNIIQIYEVGEFAGMPYFSLELAAGGSLSKKVAKEAQPPKYAAEMVEKLAHAMHYAHEHGVVHRDLKPANILLMPDGSPKIADFGLAKQIDDDSGATVSGQVLGSPSYMSPEQARGEGFQAGPPADIYALGAILYDLLTGRPPFSGSSVLDTLEMVRTMEPVRPRDLTAKIPIDLETICLKCLEKEPRKRYPTAKEMAEDIRRFLDDKPILARPIGRIERAWRWSKRNPIGAIAIVLTALLFIVPSLLSWQLYLAKEGEAAEKRQAQKERDQKEIARQAEETAKIAAIEADKKTKIERDEKIKALEVTGTQRRLSLDVLRGIILFMDGFMKNDDRFVQVRQLMLMQAMSDLQKVSTHARENPLEDRTEAAAYSRVGDVFFKSGRISEAREWHEKALTISQKLYDADPTDVALQNNISSGKVFMAQVEWRLGNGFATRKLFDEALQHRTEHYHTILNMIEAKKATVDDQIRSMGNLADCYEYVGSTALRLGDLQKAIYHYEAAGLVLGNQPKFARNLPQQRKQAEFELRLGDIKLRQGRRTEAEQHYLKALKHREYLLSITPKPKEAVMLLETDIGQSHMYLGDFWVFQAQPDWLRAEDHYRKALALFEKAKQDFPHNMPIQQYIAALQIRLGVSADHASRSAVAGGAVTRALAQDFFTKAVTIREKQAELDRRDTVYQVELMLAVARQGNTQAAMAIAKQLTSLKDRDLQVRFQTVCGFSLVFGNTSDAKEAEEAEEAKKLAIQEVKELVRLGWGDKISLMYDPDVAAMQRVPEFVAVVQAMN